MKSNVPIPASISVQQPAINNARLGMILFVASEVMLFGGLMAGFIVLRFGSGQFAGMERLPMNTAGVNSGILLLSSLLLIFGTRASKRGERGAFRIYSLATLLAGSAFLIAQLIEWNTLMGEGLLPKSSIYGGMFYLLSWAHGIHVLGGVILLAVLTVRAFRSSAMMAPGNFLSVVSIYWHFVTLVWLGLFVFVFIA